MYHYEAFTCKTAIYSVDFEITREKGDFLKTTISHLTLNIDNEGIKLQTFHSKFKSFHDNQSEKKNTLCKICAMLIFLLSIIFYLF